MKAWFWSQRWPHGRRSRAPRCVSTGDRRITASWSRRDSAPQVVALVSTGTGGGSATVSTLERAAGRDLRRLQDQARHLRARVRPRAHRVGHERLGRRRHHDLDGDDVDPVHAGRERGHRALGRQARRALRPVRPRLRHHRRRRGRHRREHLSAQRTTSGPACAIGSHPQFAFGALAGVAGAFAWDMRDGNGGAPSTTTSSGLTSIFAQLQVMGVF